MDNGLEVVGNSAWVIIVRERAGGRASARETASPFRVCRLGGGFWKSERERALIYHSDRENGAW